MDAFLLSRLGSLTEHETAETWSRQDLVTQIVKRAGWLYSLGIRAGDRVLIMHGNNNRFFGDLFAVWLLGATAACADEGIGLMEFEGSVEAGGFKLAIVKGGCPEKLASSTVIAFANTMDAEEGVRASVPIPSHYRLDRDALILYTSGSTGLPKGVVHTFRTLQAKWFALRNHIPLDVSERTLCLLPTHFGHGLICNCLYPLVHGQHLVILPKFNMTILAQLASIIEQHQVTFMSSVPAVWKVALRLCPAPAKKLLRQVHVGSAPLSGELWEQVQQWTGTKRVWNMYGITETGSWMAGPDGEISEPVDGFIGKGWDTDILITSRESMDGLKSPADVASFCLPPGERGYVWLRTPCTMKEYLNRPDLTQAVVQGSWFYTGDIGYLDEMGNLVLVGRARSEINKGGIKISPEEIDLALEKHPAIAEACSFGIKDDVLGENVAAAIVISEDRQESGVQDLVEFCSGLLSDYKIPATWFKVDNIPKTSRGKINRANVAEFCQSLSPLF